MTHSKFKRGGIYKYRKESGYLGVGCLALKTGVPVVPVSIEWDNPRPTKLFDSLITPAYASIRYGNPIIFETDTHPTKGRRLQATFAIMNAIHQLQNS